MRLANIDDLEATVQAHHPRAVAVRQAAEVIVQEELASFSAWQAARPCVPVIQALRQRASAICQAEVEKTLRRMGELSPSSRRPWRPWRRPSPTSCCTNPSSTSRRRPTAGRPTSIVELTGRLFGLN